MSGIEIWAVTAVALFLKSQALAILQGHVRIKNKAYAKPEDAKVYGKGAEALAADLPVVQRAQGAIRNDGENIPYFLLIGLAHVQLGCWEAGVPWLFGTFFVARCAHSIFMVSPRQPHRTLAYAIGMIVTFVLSAQVVWEVFA
jgi:uncharacterized MAPEG superfamily protein